MCMCVRRCFDTCGTRHAGPLWDCSHERVNEEFKLSTARRVCVARFMEFAGIPTAWAFVCRIHRARVCGDLHAASLALCVCC